MTNTTLLHGRTVIVVVAVALFDYKRGRGINEGGWVLCVYLRKGVEARCLLVVFNVLN